MPKNLMPNDYFLSNDFRPKAFIPNSFRPIDIQPIHDLIGNTKQDALCFINAIALKLADQKFERFTKKPGSQWLTVEDLPDVIKFIDLSEHGLLQFLCTDFSDLLNLDNDSKMFSHGVMGSAKENFNLVEWMTGYIVKARTFYKLR